MEKKFVTYPIALMLKELGYNEPCFKVYDEKGFLQDEDVMDKLKLIKVLAPLWQDVIDWFRKTYHLHIKYMIEDADYIYDKTWDYGIFDIDWGGDREVRYLIRDFNYKTFEEAREASILKAIEIIKKK